VCFIEFELGHMIGLKCFLFNLWLYGVAATMDVAYSQPRSKHPLGGDIGNTHKRLQYPLASPGETVFRILFPEAKADGVIGKGGGIVT